jgi:hypothetical protein
MTGADKVVCQAATLLLLFTLTTMPAKAQFPGLGGGGGGGGGGDDMMTQMAPMLEMMKARMGKRRFGMMMQTMGPMMGRMMEGGGGGGLGGLGGMMGGGGIPGGYGGGIADSHGVNMGGIGGGNIMGMLDGGGGGEMMSMIPQMMRMTNVGGGRHGRRHRRR